MDLDIGDAAAEQTKLLKSVRAYGSHIGANAGSIPHYGECHRAGGTISTAFAELDRQPGDQQTHGQQATASWTPHGAHVLRQVRTESSTTNSPTTSTGAPGRHSHHRTADFAAWPPQIGPVSATAAGPNACCRP